MESHGNGPPVSLVAATGGPAESFLTAAHVAVAQAVQCPSPQSTALAFLAAVLLVLLVLLFQALRPRGVPQESRRAKPTQASRRRPRSPGGSKAERGPAGLGFGGSSGDEGVTGKASSSGKVVTRTSTDGVVKLASKERVFARGSIVKVLIEEEIDPRGTAADRLEQSYRAERTDRNAHVDNAKFLLMVFVIWGHTPLLAEQVAHPLVLPSARLEQAVWFHMPTFAILSGMVCKPLTAQRALKLFVFLIVPLFTLVGIIGASANYFLSEEEKEKHKEFDTIGNPISAGLLGSGPFHLWYLRCLLIWRFAAALLGRFPRLLQFVLALAAAAACASLDGGDWGATQQLGPFAAVRAVQMFPYFSLGQYVSWQVVLGDSSSPGLCQMLICWVALIGLAYVPIFDSSYFGQTISGLFREVETFPLAYTSMRKFVHEGCAVEVGLLWARYIIGMSLRLTQAIIFLSIGTPRVPTWFTEAGKHTMYSYILHPLAAAGVAKLTVASLGPDSNPFILFAVWFVTSVFLAWFLATRLIRGLVGFILEPHWLEAIIRRVLSLMCCRPLGMSLAPPQVREPDVVEMGRL